MNVRFKSLEELAALVKDGYCLGIGGLHFSRLPIALLKQIIIRQPKNLEYVSWGGGLPLEMLLGAGAIRRVSFCFSSLDIFGLAPLFRKALEKGEVEVDEWTALGMIQGFHAAQQQLPSMPFQLPVGSQIRERSAFAPEYSDPISGTMVGAARPLKLDVFLLHAQRADEDGNIELQGARGLDMSAAFAANSILITVEEIVPRGTFQHGPRAAILPRNFVTAIAHSPGGAYPASCLPYYITDYSALMKAVASVPLQASKPTAERLEFLGKAAKIPNEISFGSKIRPHGPSIHIKEPATVDEIMIAYLAQDYTNESICAAGAVSPLAIISYLLAKRTHAPELAMLMFSSGLVDIEIRPMLLALAESIDFQTAVIHCGGDDTYHQYYQRGLVTHEVVSAAQIDRFGRANNIEIKRPDGSPIRLPGQGGMADVANMHKNFLMYLPRHSSKSLVAEVDCVSAARGLITPNARKAAGYQPGYVKVVTNLGVLQLDENSNELELVSIHPNVTIDQVKAETGFPLQVSSNMSITPSPTREQLEILRYEIDPLGIRRLEFIPSRNRTELLSELILSEEAVITDFIK